MSRGLSYFTCDNEDGRLDDDSKSTVSTASDINKQLYGSEIVTIEQLLAAISKQRVEDKVEARAEAERVRAEARAEARADREAFLDKLKDLMDSYRE